MENKDKKTFSYTYSAKEQEEIKKIRERYVAPQETELDKMEQLRRLDASVAKKGTMAALIIGIIGTLIMGTGMSLIMTEFREILGSYSNFAMPIGIVLGVTGMILIAFAYPSTIALLKKSGSACARKLSD